MCLTRCCSAAPSQSGSISATNANLIYTTQPLWSALFAWLLLGEILTPTEAAGGLGIAAAVWLATTGSTLVADGEA